MLESHKICSKPIATDYGAIEICTDYKDGLCNLITKFFIKRKLLIAHSFAPFVSCSNDGDDLQEVENVSGLQKSSELSPESEYEGILSSRYGDYTVGEWMVIEDENGGLTHVKVVANGVDPIAYLIEDPTDGHYLFAAKNEDTETLFVRDFTNDLLIDGSYAGTFPVAVEIQHPDSGTVTQGWFRRFTWTFMGWGTSQGDWGGCIGGLRYRTITHYASIFFIEFENEMGQESKAC